MRIACPSFLTGARGFTLIELILVVIMLGITAAGIITLNAHIFDGQEENEDLLVGVAMMQECAELILATRQKGSFDHASLADTTDNATICGAITQTGFAAPTVTITSGDSGSTGMEACPYGGGTTDCKLVSISQGGMTPVTLLLVNDSP